MRCDCAGEGHELWCPLLVADVDTSVAVPTDEGEEAAIQRGIELAVERMVDKVGHEKLLAALMPVLLKREAHMRANFHPDHSMLRLLDDYHRGNFGKRL